jgi:ABC-type multidrug transport system ATPase subunit
MAGTHGDNALELFSVSVERAGREILHDLALRALPGDGVAVIGANGAGKTTLLRTIAGLERRRAGRIGFGGEVVDPESEGWCNRVSFCPDDGLVVAELTVREHLLLAALLFRASEVAADSRARAVEAMLGLADYASYRGAELSFGLARRLSIGVAIARDADLFLFDEPWIGLDAQGIGALRGILERLRRGKRTVLVAGQVGPHLVGVANRVWLLANGSARAAVGAEAQAMLVSPPPSSHTPPVSDGEGALPWLV